MIEQRRHERFDPVTNIVGYFELTKELTGQFRNFEEFVVKNISVSGYNLLSNYSPSIGQNYQIFINYGNKKHEFEIKIIHSRISRILEAPQSVFRSGVVYAIGCEVVIDRALQKNLAMEIIKNDCEHNQTKS
jgi:hypothetical protein